MIRILPLLALGALCSTHPAPAQDDETQSRDAALRAWHHALTRRLDVDQRIHIDAHRHIYGALLGVGGLLHGRVDGGMTHLGALRVLLDDAETGELVHGTAEVVLQLAAAGLDKKLTDHRAIRVRELAQWTLMRMDGNEVLRYLMRVAGGSKVAKSDDEETFTTVLQVAALRVLGAKNLAIFRSTIERRLLDTDPRIRLAAAEALARMRRRATLPTLGRALGAEKHPVVVQALIGAIDRTMRRHLATLRLFEMNPPLRTALRRLGRVSWRADLGIVALLERFPIREAVPVLIDILDEEKWGKDELVDAVNEHASPILRERAWYALRRLTGAILPLDHAEWREFWASEQDKITLHSPQSRANRRIVTSSQFYGIPVTGREVAFIIDVSNSMKRAMVGAQRGDGPQTRLEAAKSQLLRAVQGIHPKSRYHLLTFSAIVTDWSARAVTPTPESYRRLTEAVQRIDYEGGTDIYAALMRVLDTQVGNFGVPNQNPIDEMFLLSDGEPVSGEVRNPELILKIVRELNKYQKVRINAVFLGTGKGAPLMRQLAEENDGMFVRV